MHVAFGRVRRKIALLRTGFSLMRTVYSEMVSVVSFQFNMDKKPLAEHYQDFRDALLMWFKEYQREMPWRDTGRSLPDLGLGGDAPADAGQEGCGLL